MAWFKVDDSFYDHPKAIKAGPAVELWLRAGCWSAKQGTDGYVPAWQLQNLRGGTAKMAQRLVDAWVRPGGSGLWVPVEGGWSFHDWLDYQPSKDEADERRAKRAEAGRIGGLRSGQSRRGTEANREANASAGARSKNEPRPGPARPPYVITLAGRLTKADANPETSPPAEIIVASWQEFAGPHVDLEREAVAYLARFADSPPRDERAAWLGWLQRARDRAAPAAASPKLPDCATPGCIGGWLPDDHDARPVPCPTCRPHLRPVATEEAS